MRAERAGAFLIPFLRRVRRGRDRGKHVVGGLSSGKHPVKVPERPRRSPDTSPGEALGGEKLLSVRRRVGKTLVAVLAASALVASLAGAARAAETSFNRSRTILFNGEPTFPLVLSPGPPLNGSTPWGTNGLAETAAAGVNVYRTGQAGPGRPPPSSRASTGTARPRRSTSTRGPTSAVTRLRHPARRTTRGSRQRSTRSRTTRAAARSPSGKAVTNRGGPASLRPLSSSPTAASPLAAVLPGAPASRRSTRAASG